MERPIQTETAGGAVSTPRGIRNNNPGNVIRDKTLWRGAAADQSSDPRFVVFDSPTWGIRAACVILLNYQIRHGLHTVTGLINRWAPPVENDTRAYVSAVAKALSVGPLDPVDVTQAATLGVLVRAVIQHENGQQPYDDMTIDKGVHLALSA